MVAAACSAPDAAPRPERSAGAGDAAGAAGPIFVDRAREAGLDFTYWNGMSGELYMVEMVGGGAALLDYDGDHDLDVFFPQGTMLGAGKSVADALLPPPAAGLRDRLFRNELDPAAGPTSLRFTDVSATALPDDDEYGQGVAVGDVDNDGWPDLLVTTYEGESFLLRNSGDATFRRVALPASASAMAWPTSATFFDYDADGLLDAFITRYVDATIANHSRCKAANGLVDYCGPLTFAPTTSVLLRNVGGGRFADLSAASGIDSKKGSGLGVIALDADGDGRQDLYVANDQMENFLWLNQGDGTFREEAGFLGCAVNAEGKPEASMGVDAADFDGDGDRDLFLTHLTEEHDTLYLNEGAGIFRDVTAASGLGPPSMTTTSFGTHALDYDGDGWLDLLVANGAVRIIEQQMRAGEALPLRQSNQLFRNVGGGRFVEAGEETGAALALENVGRGVASGDLDNDGDTDAVVVNNSAPAQLLVNQVGAANGWIGFRVLLGERDALGASVTLELESGLPRRRWVHSDGSFLAANDARVLFGLAGGAVPTGVAVRWPDGREERWPAPAPGRYWSIRPGQAPAPLERAAVHQ